jgi:hypothetical protein
MVLVELLIDGDGNLEILVLGIAVALGVVLLGLEMSWEPSAMDNT